jgi:beta-aspartyl-dipeptidase (metallo-type)
MISLVHGGDVFTPDPRGRADLVASAGRVLALGAIDERALDALGAELTRLDASGAYVVPGLVDPHEHVIGGSGESGFATASPEIFPSEIARAGITTVVGCLGTDTTMKQMSTLLGKVMGLRAEGLAAFAYTGGYTVPPETLLGSVRKDIMFLDPVIGLGEVAIADDRAMEPGARELARLVSDAAVGGRLAGKAGLTHFHVGSAGSRLSLLRQLLDEFDVDPGTVYPTHCNRTPELFDEAIALTRRGVPIDIDTTAEELPRWLRVYRDAGAPRHMLTVSTDADSASPSSLWAQARAAAADGWRLEELLPFLTTNPARVLRLERKGRLEPGCDADVLVVERDTLAIRHVMASGRVLVRDGACLVHEAFRSDSARRFSIDGDQKHPE